MNNLHTHRSLAAAGSAARPAVFDASLIRELPLSPCCATAFDAPIGHLRRLDDGSLLWIAPPSGPLLRPGERVLFWYRVGKGS